MRSVICEKYILAAIILANKHTSLVTSGVTLGFPVVHMEKTKLKNAIWTTPTMELTKSQLYSLALP